MATNAGGGVLTRPQERQRLDILRVWRISFVGIFVGMTAMSEVEVSLD